MVASSRERSDAGSGVRRHSSSATDAPPSPSSCPSRRRWGPGRRNRDSTRSPSPRCTADRTTATAAATAALRSPSTPGLATRSMRRLGLRVRGGNEVLFPDRVSARCAREAQPARAGRARSARSRTCAASAPGARRLRRCGRKTEQRAPEPCGSSTRRFPRIVMAPSSPASGGAGYLTSRTLRCPAANAPSRRSRRRELAWWSRR
jgi:hypothetical protein